MPDTITASFTLKLEGRLLDFAVAVPSRPITLRELLPSLFEFNRQLLDHAIDRETKAGRRISCRAGCGACCRQLVPIGAIDAAIGWDWVGEIGRAAWRERVWQYVEITGGAVTIQKQKK